MASSEANCQAPWSLFIIVYFLISKYQYPLVEVNASWFLKLCRCWFRYFPRNFPKRRGFLFLYLVLLPLGLLQELGVRNSVRKRTEGLQNLDVPTEWQAQTSSLVAREWESNIKARTSRGKDHVAMPWKKKYFMRRLPSKDFSGILAYLLFRNIWNTYSSESSEK